MSRGINLLELMGVQTRRSCAGLFLLLSGKWLETGTKSPPLNSFLRADREGLYSIVHPEQEKKKEPNLFNGDYTGEK